MQAAAAPRVFTGPLWTNLLWDVLFGACVGLVIGLIRYGIKWKSGAVEKVISALGSRKVVTAAQVGAACVLVHVVIGAASGAAVGLLGLTQPPQLWSGEYLDALRGGPAGGAFITAGLLGGGSGGPPPVGPGIVVWIAVALAALALSIILSAVAAATFNVAVVLTVGEGVASGAAKGAGKSFGVALGAALVRLWYTDGSKSEAPPGGSVGAGLVTGALAGGLGACISLACVYVADRRVTESQRESMQVAEEFVLKGRGDSDARLSFSPDGRVLAYVAGDGAIKLWDVRGGRELRALVAGARREGRPGLNSYAFSPDGKLLAAGAGDATVRMWATANGRALTPLMSYGDKLDLYKNRVLSVAFGPDGKLLAVASEYGKVRLWDAAAANELREIHVCGGDIPFLAFNADGTRLLCGCSSGYASLLATADGARIHETFVGRSAAAFGLSSDGKTLAVSSENYVALVSVGEKLGRLRSLEHAGVRAQSFRPDGRILASGAADGTIRFWSLGNVLELRTVGGHRSAVTSLAFSPDGRVLASGAEDGEIKLWSVRWLD